MMSLPSDRQLEALCVAQPAHGRPLVPTPPKWLVLCGLGEGWEIPTCHRYWPTTRVVGIDFDRKAIDYCRASAESRDLLLEAALSDRACRSLARLNALGNSTLHPQMVEKEGATAEVTTTTLDALDAAHGPFDDCVLWVDAEGSDPKILAGAAGLLWRHAPLALVVEVWTARPDLVKEYTGMRFRLLASGYHLVDVLNPEWWGHNEVYLRHDLADELIRAG